MGTKRPEKKAARASPSQAKAGPSKAPPQKVPPQKAPPTTVAPAPILIRPPVLTVEQAITTPEAIPIRLIGKVPHVAPGTYADGLPLHNLNYLAFKLILSPNSFTSRQSLFGINKVVRELAAQHGIGYTPVLPAKAPIRVREVVFIDTADNRFYNNSFILRRRIVYEDGFPIGEPEIVFKYRHWDLQKTAETDVRPHINGAYRIKFKAQLLPLKDALGGARLLFSHNVQFARSTVRMGDRFTMNVLTEIFPVLARIKTNRDEPIALVNDTIVEEVLQDLGVIDFGSGLTARVDAGIWRTRGEHRPLIGELAYQVKFKYRSALPAEAMKKVERFFIALQFVARDFMALNATKTGVVYRLLGNAPTLHE